MGTCGPAAATAHLVYRLCPFLLLKRPPRMLSGPLSLRHWVGRRRGRCELALLLPYVTRISCRRGSPLSLRFILLFNLLCQPTASRLFHSFLHFFPSLSLVASLHSSLLATYTGRRQPCRNNILTTAIRMVLTLARSSTSSCQNLPPSPPSSSPSQPALLPSLESTSSISSSCPDCTRQSFSIRCPMGKNEVLSTTMSQQ